MSQMKYYVDAAGAYLGGWDANPPAGAIEVPAPPEDARQVWGGEAWGWPHPSLEEAKAAKLAELDEIRWQVEIGGTEMAGITIRTDPNSQAKVAAAYTMARLDPAYEVPTWEALPGLFAPLSNAQLIAMGEAVRDHVQDTFNRKAVLHAAITALESVEAVEVFDIAAEW
ncbi:DUF4376 domain-containing protein [Devosia honganensis]|uniref:DUF4376 domain-containing protein n=1 Tax=Devosia honganensis TaxID=1610527 RepID=A0ABV7X5C2_9HYPH